MRAARRYREVIAAVHELREDAFAMWQIREKVPGADRHTIRDILKILRELGLLTYREKAFAEMRWKVSRQWPRTEEGIRDVLHTYGLRQELRRAKTILRD